MSCDRKIGPYPCCSVVQGDCLELMRELPDGCVDAVITDPPYPDYHAELYGYDESKIVAVLSALNCRQFVFWCARENFPLDWTAVHIWDKKTGCGSWYERLFERNGNTECKVLRHYLINSTVAASLTGDVFTGHPSQKPIALMDELVGFASGTVLDPFCGSGTTLVAAKKLGRHFLGFEISEAYVQIARERLARIDAQPSLFEPKPEQLELGGE